MVQKERSLLLLKGYKEKEKQYGHVRRTNEEMW